MSKTVAHSYIVVDNVWEVFVTATGALVMTGTCSSADAAEAQAQAVVTQLTLPRIILTRTPGGWSATHPAVAGPVPLPLTSAADEAKAVAYVRTLPIAAGRIIEVR